MLPARLPELKALPAIFDAWLNLSHRENARLLVTVKTSAIATSSGGKMTLSAYYCPFAFPVAGPSGTQKEWEGGH